jgi:YVTN family beta-propeller protein
VEFRILGPLEVVDDGRPVSIRRGKEQALLVYLLLHANEVVPSGRLIDALWDERPPPTASKILQNAVSHLRKELGGDRLVTRDSGYLLRVADEELDVQRFERLAKDGRNEDALALWRGTPLLGLTDERFADDARRRLDEQRQAVLEDRIDDDLAAGLHDELVPELEQLVREHPLRERLQGQLMRALYGAGRQADALEAYRAARKTLGEELGLEPSPELQELERKILRQDPELAAPRRVRTRTRTGAEPRRRIVLALGGALLVAGLVVGAVYAFGGSSRPLLAYPNSLAVIDPSNNKVVHVVTVGDTPRGVVVGRNAVWVANSADGTVSKLDRDTLRVIQTIGIGAQATDLVESNGRVWVTTGFDDSVVPIDARSGGVQDSIRLPGDQTASAYAVAAGAGALWASSGNRLVQIDPRTGTIVEAPHIGRGRGALSGCCFSIHDLDFGDGAIWLADGSETLARVSLHGGRITGSTLLGVIPVAVKVGYGAVWVGVPDPNRPVLALWRVDPRTVRVTQTITLGSDNNYLASLDVAIGAGSVWVTNYEAGTLTRVDPTSLDVIATIKIGSHPYGVTVGAGRVWVTVS